MNVKHSFAVAVIALAGAGAASADGNNHDINKDGHITSSASSGTFSAYIDVRPLADGSFDEWVRFDTEQLRTITTDLSGSHGLTWGAITLTHGDEVFTNFTSGNSTNRSGTKSGGDDTGFYTLHLKGNVSSLTEHHNGEYRVQVTAVPEPETLGMLLAGLGIVGWASRRRTSPATLAG